MHLPKYDSEKKSNPITNIIASRADKANDEKKHRKLDHYILELSELVAFNQPINLYGVKDNKMREFYQKWNDLQKNVSGLCKVWNEKESLRSTYDAANEILNVYYKRGKLLDYLERINRYLSDLSGNEDPTLAFNACYNNYISSLKIFMDELEKKYKNLQNLAKSDSPSDTEVDIPWIVANECGDLSCVSVFSKAIDSAKVLKTEVTQHSFSKEDDKSFRMLNNIKEEYQYGNEINGDIDNVKTKISQLKQQILYMNDEIQKAEQLHKDLNAVLSYEWFGQFEKDNISFETCADVKEMLSQAMHDVNVKIVAFYNNIGHNKK